MKNNQEVTLEAIAELIEASAKKTSEALEAKIEASAKKTIEILEVKIDSSIEGLATSTQKQFLELEEKLGKKIDNIDERLINVEKKIDRIEGEIIKKVNKEDHNTLIYRVEKLEEKFA